MRHPEGRRRRRLGVSKCQAMAGNVGMGAGRGGERDMREKRGGIGFVGGPTCPD